MLGFEGLTIRPADVPPTALALAAPKHRGRHAAVPPLLLVQKSGKQKRNRME